MKYKAPTVLQTRQNYPEENNAFPKAKNNRMKYKHLISISREIYFLKNLINTIKNLLRDELNQNYQQFKINQQVNGS